MCDRDGLFHRNFSKRRFLGGGAAAAAARRGAEYVEDDLRFRLTKDCLGLGSRHTSTQTNRSCLANVRFGGTGQASRAAGTGPKRTCERPAASVT